MLPFKYGMNKAASLAPHDTMTPRHCSEEPSPGVTRALGLQEAAYLAVALLEVGRLMGADRLTARPPAGLIMCSDEVMVRGTDCRAPTSSPPCEAICAAHAYQQQLMRVLTSPHA